MTARRRKGPAPESDLLNVMRAFKVVELSGVDVPMQGSARAVLMKRRSEDEDEEDPDDDESLDAPKEKGKKAAKALRLLSDVDGHSHLLDDSEPGGTTSWAKSTGEEYGHSHPWVRNADGSIEIGADSDHTHDVRAEKAYVSDTVAKALFMGAVKRAKETEVNENETIQKLQADLDRARAFGALNDAEKAAFETLSKSEQDAFLVAGPASRAATIAKAAELNPVVYKSDDGVEYRKSDDARLVEMAKRSDADRKAAHEAIEKAGRADLEKRADTVLKHFAGDLSARTALLGAVDAIKDEAVRKAALESLAGADAALRMVKTSVGVSGSPPEGSAEAKLDKMARDRAAEKGETYEQAYATVSKSGEGARLFAESLAG